MNRLADEYFEVRYAADPDPWGFESSWYEQRKYALTLGALPHEHYARAFEPGCANGALTERLARRCDELVALELVPAVAARARERMRGQRHVTVHTGALPEAWPSGRFDLFVLSEVLYYLKGPALVTVLDRLAASAMPGAHVVAVHWRGETDYPLRATVVHGMLAARWSRLVQYREAKFALDVFEVSP